MKTFFRFSILLLFVATIVSCGGKQQAKTDDEQAGDETSVSATVSDADKKLPFERGSYVQEVLGKENMQTTVYFDRWGDWQATESKFEMNIMGHTIKTHTIDIVKGNKHWEINMIEKTGRYYEFNIPKGMETALAAAVGGAMMEGMEVKELGEETYLGYPCKKTFVKSTNPNMPMETTTLTYGKLAMKTEGNMSGIKLDSRVVSIDLTPPPASIFEVPEGIKFEGDNANE